MAEVGVLGAAVQLPAKRVGMRDLFTQEGVRLTPEIERRLGIESVPVAVAEKGSEMALAAAQAALGKAGVAAADLDVIVDYSILPQEYLVPAWNMSNKIQHELGAKKAFTAGFSGGSASNFLVSLNFAAAVILANPHLKNALLVAADVTIPGNRVLNPEDPISVMGDSAGAVVLQRDAGHKILGTELLSDGEYHDVCYIPGGALAHTDRADLYRVQIDKKRYEATPRMETVKRLGQSLLDSKGLAWKDVGHFIYTNISAEDQREFETALDVPEGSAAGALKSHGHLQGTDLVVNYLEAAGKAKSGEHALMAAHGMGFMGGATLVQF